mgnify:CR=1 FL=1
MDFIRMFLSCLLTVDTGDFIPVIRMCKYLLLGALYRRKFMVRTLFFSGCSELNQPTKDEVSCRRSYRRCQKECRTGDQYEQGDHQYLRHRITNQ